VYSRALVLADTTHDATLIRKSTVAIIFMGTPHRGADIASYAKTALTCIKAVGISANTSSVQKLKLDSEDLGGLNSQFGTILQLRKIKVLTFYELKPTKIGKLADTLVSDA
jgi:hypothetical protein